MDNDAPTEEHRKFSRIPFETNIHLVSAEGSWNCKLLDISLKGMLAVMPSSWHSKIGTHYLAEMLTENDEATIRMEVSVMHLEANHAGFRCEHIDLDSISHLRRLVELNLGDPDILERELSELSHG